jgi:ATP-dependent 26S proteasome regulatory subunit
VLLNRLLNEMDGLKENAEILFVLTTNRPDALEPALAARPGRIDQAIAFPLPDENGRRKLVSLYARGLDLSDELRDLLARRTDGVSASFIKELMRRTAQVSLESGSDGPVVAAHVEAALDEMLRARGELGSRLVGGG